MQEDLGKDGFREEYTESDFCENVKYLRRVLSIAEREQRGRMLHQGGKIVNTGNSKSM